MKQAEHYRLIRTYVAGRVERLELTPSSGEVIEPVLRQWVRHVELRPPRQWTPELVATWVNDTRLRPSYRKSRLTKLRPYVRWLVLEGHLDRDPTLRIGKIPVCSADPRDLTFEEIAAVLAVCPDMRARLIVLVMAQLGLRAGDVARIRVEDINVRRRTLHVRAKGGRGEPTHWEPITTEAWDALRSWLSESGVGRTGPLVRSYQRPDRGLTPQAISKLIVGWMWEAGVKKAPWDGRSGHALRHSCAQHMIDGGAELRDVQKTLGHRSIRSTELYVWREPPGLRDAMEGRRYAA